MRRRVLEVGGLPHIAFGPRDPMWWGVILLAAIESTMLVLLAIAYYFVRERTQPWPPTATPSWIAWTETVTLVVVLISVWPMTAAMRAAERGELRPIRRGMMWTLGLALIAAVARVVVFAALPFHWDSHAYGSVVWGLLTLQGLHGLTGIGELVVMIALFFIGPIEDKHRVDVEASGYLWYLVVFGEALLWAVVFLEMLVTRGP